MAASLPPPYSGAVGALGLLPPRDDLPGIDLDVLRAPVWSTDDLCRFVVAFRSTWDAIPDSARRLIHRRLPAQIELAESGLEFWREDPVAHRPRVDLAYVAYTGPSVRIVFNIAVVTSLPDRELGILIAYELSKLLVLMEGDVARLAREWGFEVQRLTDWATSSPEGIALLDKLSREVKGVTTRRGYGLVVGHTDVAHQDQSHSDSHGDTSHADSHTDSHDDSAHGDSAHTDSAHVDTAHSDSHGDTAHADDAHGDSAHNDSHSDVGHSDTAHSDSHGDSAFQDNAHDDQHSDEFGDPHNDVHVDIPHGDQSHQDAHADAHGDVAHTDGHGDTSHTDEAHEDNPHSDSHGDSAHSDSAHGDTGHTDQGHVDAHGDVAHQDQSHADSHQDQAHHDSAHGDAT